MFPSNLQLPSYSKALVVRDVEADKHVGLNESSQVTRNLVPNGMPGYEDPILASSQILQADLEKYGSQIKEHEDNLKFLKAQRNQLDDSIVDTQVKMGKYHSSSTIKTEDNDSPYVRSEKETLEQIMKYGKSAAGIFCQLQAHQGFQNSSSMWIQNVIGIVATLGQVDDDKLSRLLSEYLGLDTMLALVCKSNDGVKALELYDNDGQVNKQFGIHGLGASIGRPLEGRFRVICLENLRSYGGDFVTADPQRRLDLIKPRLPNGEIPAGFLGFAVNMIKPEPNHLYCLTASGCGIRETLFYSLFSHLQVYKTRAEMLLALPFISEGAVSLDGGMIRSNGILSLGNREDVDLQFPKPSKASDVSAEKFEVEKQMKLLECERERVKEEIRREQSMLDQTKYGFQRKKQEFVKFLADSAKHIAEKNHQPAMRF